VCQLAVRIVSGPAIRSGSQMVTDRPKMFEYAGTLQVGRMKIPSLFGPNLSYTERFCILPLKIRWP
jgi:hypothetical protein